jgi:hypothetical protein
VLSGKSPTILQHGRVEQGPFHMSDQCDWSPRLTEQFRRPLYKLFEVAMRPGDSSLVILGAHAASSL